MRSILAFTIIILSYTCSIPECNSCKDNVCQVCNHPYSLFNGICVGLPCLNQNCATCDPRRYWCVRCTTIYQLKAGSCQLATYVIVAPTIIFIVGVAVIVFFCMLRSHRNKRKKEALQYLERKQNHFNYISMTPTKDCFLDNPLFHFEYQQQKSFCSICLEGKSDMITKCGHYFHADCFSCWINRNKRCPVCNNTDVTVIIAILCMNCKKKYYTYQIQSAFILQIRADSKKACKICAKIKSKASLKHESKGHQGINSQQLIIKQ